MIFCRFLKSRPDHGTRTVSNKLLTSNPIKTKLKSTLALPNIPSRKRKKLYMKALENTNIAKFIVRITWFILTTIGG
jgi:hypothetical protein